jgi:paraquat-inducible protein B
MNPPKNDEPMKTALPEAKPSVLQAETNALPQAKTRERRRLSIIWLVPLIAAIAAGWLVFKNVRATGPVIRIQFSDGSGLQPNQTVLKFLGVRIGEVRSVQLTADLTHVEVEARLTGAAKTLAREGSQFWIVRPEVGAGGLSGLETIVSGPYIQVLPGGGREQKQFIGVDEPPIMDQSKNGLEIILTTPQLNTLSVGSPVYYRGIEAGSVGYFLLSSNSTTVEIHALIKPAFALLVRTDSRFWNAGGIHLKLNLFGTSHSTEPLKSLILGGIAFVTPSSPGAAAAAGASFPLYEKMDDKWLEWSPSIMITNAAPVATQDSASSLLLNTVNPEPKE